MNIQPLTIQDIPHSNHLQPEGWGNLAMQLLEYAMLDFCKSIKIADQEKIIGTGTVILHQDSAWLAHIIVDQSYRGKGIGKQLVDHLIRTATEDGARSINLIATELGMPLYTKAGFRETGDYQRLKKIKSIPQKNVSKYIVPTRKEHYPQILEIDQAVTGETRQQLIYPHLHQSVVFLDGGVVQGYYLPKLGQGPIYAVSDDAGIELMKVKYNEVDTAILPADNEVAINFLLQHAFALEEMTARRMTYGQDSRWQPRHIFSRIGGNYG